MKTLVEPLTRVTPSQSQPQPRRRNPWKRLEARILRFFGGHGPNLSRWLLAVFFLAMGATCWLSPRASLQNSPLDFISQSLSIMSVGRISFAAAAHWLGGLEFVCGLALLALPYARLTLVLFVARLVFGFLPLVMLRDDLWRRFPTAPSAAGLGVIGLLVPVLWALSLLFQNRWDLIDSDIETTELLHETPAQRRARRLAWQRTAVVGVPLLMVGFVGFRAEWPRYLRWFHARQEAAALDEHLEGKLIKKSMPPSLLLGGRKITTWVYLPPGYDRSTQRYPVIYVMHGMPGEVRDCFVKGRVQDTAENLIETHQVHPFILVGWDGQGPGGPSDVTNYLDRPGYPMESFMTQELVPYIDRTYRTIAKPEDRALDGISAGGYGAANLLFKHPDIWRIGASHNGFFSTADDVENMENSLGRKSKLWDENDPMKTVADHTGADGLHFYGDIGDGDDLQNEFVAFGKKLKEQGIDSQMNIFPGRHTWAFWSQHFNNSFRFEDRWFRQADKPDGIQRD